MCGIFGYVGKGDTVVIPFEGENRSSLIDSETEFIHKYSPDLKYSISSMNILNLIKEGNYYVRIAPDFQREIQIRIMSTIKIAKKLGVSRNTISRMSKSENYWCNFKTLLSLTEFLQIDEERAMKSIKSVKTKDSFPMPVKNIEFNSSLARTLAHILGDGGIHVNKLQGKYRAFYVNIQDALLESFKTDIKSIFGEIPIYFRRRVNHGHEFWLGSTVGFMLYKLLQYDHFPVKRIPDWIKQSDNEFKSAFLQAMYDDEGFLYPQKYMIVIAFANRMLTEDVRELVQSIGISTNPIRLHNSKTRTLMHYFSITGRRNIFNFHRQVNFIHPIKRKKIEMLISKYKVA